MHILPLGLQLALETNHGYVYIPGREKGTNISIACVNIDYLNM